MLEETTIYDFGSNVFVDGLIAFVIHSVISLLIAHIATKIVERATKKIKIEKGRKMQVMYLNRIIKAIAYTFAIFSILDQVKALQGIGSAMLGATSVISVVVGLAAQETFGNFIAGMSLSLNLPYAVGDQITLPEKNITGTVTAMTFRQTELITLENTKVIIPNSTMNSAIIEDRAFGQKTYQRYITFSVGYDTDVAILRKIMLDIIGKEPLVVDTRSQEAKDQGEPQVNIRIDDFLDSGIQVNFPLITKNIGDSYTAASNIRIALLKAFAEKGIEIPYNKVEILNNSSK